MDLTEEFSQTPLLQTPLFILKKRLLLVTFFVRYLFVGAEYSVILPSVLLYMESLAASKMFMGVVVAAYPLAAIISLPLFGYLYDRTKRTKELLLVLNGFQIIGNILYSLPYSKYLPVIGRFLAGLGDGFITLVVGEVTYLYTKTSRIGILSILELGRVCGMTIGPTLNFFLEKKSYFVGTWMLNSNTLPGVIMATCWLIMEAITVFCAFNLTKELLNAEKTDNLHQPLVEVKDEEQFTDQLSEFESSDGDDSFTDASEAETKKEIPQEELSYWGSISELFSIEFFIIFAVDLVLWFSQTIFEILMPYVTEFEYKWTSQITGSVYMVGGILLLVIFLAIYLLGEKCGNKDVNLLLFSLILTQIALGLMMYETIQKKYWARVTIFCSVSLLVFTTIPFNLVCSKSLLTKLMRPELQGMVQGISSAISRLAMIGGPLLSGIIFTNRKEYAAIASVFCYTTLVALFCSLQRISKREKKLMKSLSE